MRYWVAHPYGYTPLKLTPAARATKLLDLSPNAVLEGTDTMQEADGVIWRRVIYVTDKNKPNYIGWVDSGRIDPYNESLPKDCVDLSDIETPSRIDAAQYITYGKVQYNMCGEIALCMLLGIKLSEMLTVWQRKDATFFQRIFRWNTSKVATGTSDGDLKRLAALFGVEMQPLGKRYPYYTPGIIGDLHNSIVSVHIDNNGNLVGGGILHWVLIRNSWQECNGWGDVEYFDPFTNRVRIRSYNLFSVSAGQPYGIK